MAELKPGTNAPNIELQTLDGAKFSLEEARRSQAPVFASFFKVSCPTCQYTFPFLERIYRAYAKDGVRFIGVSQNNSADTAEFVRQFGITFPVLLDPERNFPASRAYGLKTVPSIFAISPAGKLEQSSVGWVKADIEDLNRRVAAAAGVPPVPIFKPGEMVADFKSG
jgi:peroxiredoxin